jgi:group I intron endonuclease
MKKLKNPNKLHIDYDGPGIYCIINTLNNKKYIGSSSFIRRRIQGHYSGLKLNKHANKYLQHAFNQCEHFFKVEILEKCTNILEREQYYLDLYKPEYNIAKDAFSVMKDRKHSEETLNKLRGRNPWNKGVPRTEEEKRYISQRKKEEFSKKSPEWYKNISEIHKKNPSMYWKGKKLPKEMYDKICLNAKLKSQKIKCLNTGEVFNSQLEASIKLNIRQGHIAEVLSGKRKSASGFLFERVKNENP